MSDLLGKWLNHYDPIHRGWTRAGIANGVTAMHGCSFPRRKGGYLLYLGTSLAGIDMARPVGAASHDATVIRLFPWICPAPATRYYVRLVAIGPGGVESVENPKDRQVVAFTTGDGGEVPDPVPPAPRSLEVLPIAGGKFRIRFLFVPSRHFARAAQFRVYGNNGSGAVVYATPVHTIAARPSLSGAGHYAWDTAAFDHGTSVKWAVRARTTEGGEETNTVVAEAQADAQGPADHQLSSIAYGDDE